MRTLGSTFIVFLIAMTMAGSGSVSWAGAPFIRSDATTNGTLDISDPIQTLLYIAGQTTLDCLDAADADDDGLVTVVDAIYALHFLFQSTPLGMYDAREKLADAFLCGYAAATSRELDAVKFDDFRRRYRPLQDKVLRVQRGTRPWFKKIPFRLRQRRVQQAWQRYCLPENVRRSFSGSRDCPPSPGAGPAPGARSSPR